MLDGCTAPLTRWQCDPDLAPMTQPGVTRRASVGQCRLSRYHTRALPLLTETRQNVVRRNRRLGLPPSGQQSESDAGTKYTCHASTQGQVFSPVVDDRI
jgi:hypothetical protein